ncbi:MAG TPA: dipeptidase [Acetobacteraceae bacterium]|nr:dipeptidase [Acetobacteraceae bacterium]
MVLDAASVHAGLLTLDSHIDIPWPETPDPFIAGPRAVDFPKMRAGHLVAGCFVAYVPQGPRSPEGHAAARDRALAMLAAIRDMARSEPGLTVHLADTVDGVEAAHRAGALAVVPAVENGYAIGEDLALLARFRALGARYVTLTHNGHNALADSARPRSDLHDPEALHGGLSPLGRAAIAEINRLGMLVDVSHASRQTMLQAAQCSAVPVVATHSCTRALCDHPRNMDDLQLDALRDTGGLIQITAVPAFVRSHGTVETVRVAHVCDHIDYAVQRCGLGHVGIGSDFDGGGGVAGWRDASESANLTAELLRRGYGETELAQLWGGNFLRLLRLAEAKAEGAAVTTAPQAPAG